MKAQEQDKTQTAGVQNAEESAKEISTCEINEIIYNYDLRCK